MENVYILPGYLSTELYQDPSLTDKLWISYYELGLGRAGRMRLAPNGLDPGPPDGVRLYAGGADPDYWRGPARELQRQLGGEYFVQQIGFDWRKELYHHGQILASLIRAGNTPAAPCSIVAHSTGGLVARAAWTELVSTAQHDLVRRIVTLGTPHQGTYSSPQILTGESRYLDDLITINVWGRGISVVSDEDPSIYRTNSRIELAGIAASWPSLYELFPVRGSENSAADPHRDDLFIASNWDGLPVPSQAWLTLAASTWAEWLNSPASVPPSWVLTTVSGTGFGGGQVLWRPDRLGHPDAFREAEDGDQVVSQSSAEILPGRVYSLVCRHTDLPFATISSGFMAEWIREVRSPITPATPAITTGLVSPIFAGQPPIPHDNSVFLWPNLCEQGRCHC